MAKITVQQMDGLKAQLQDNLGEIAQRLAICSTLAECAENIPLYEDVVRLLERTRSLSRGLEGSPIITTSHGVVGLGYPPPSAPAQSISPPRKYVNVGPYKVYPVDRAELEEALGEDCGMGFCVSCGSSQGGCEPDARGYTCEGCGEKKVYSAEEILISGWYK